MARLMCFVTHHKGGTIWTRHVVRGMGEAFGIPVCGLWRDALMRTLPEAGPAFVVNWEGWLPTALWARDDIAVVHLIRDPRDVLLSGCVYHHLAGEKGERWLHAPNPAWGGLTYQQKLRAIESDNEKLLFEMDGKHLEYVEQLRAWPFGRPGIFELRYEDLMRDSDCALFRRALSHLGLEGEQLERGARIFWEQSLFGGMARPDDRPEHVDRHISSDGRLQRWRRELPRAVGEVYAERYGADLVALGYEPDQSWVSGLAVSERAYPAEQQQEGGMRNGYVS